MSDLAPRCTFYERVEVPGGYRYTMLAMNPKLVMAYPPQVGDLIHLQGHTGSYRVVERAFLPSQYGSTDWPSGDQPSSGPLLDIICERTEGPFRNEVSDPNPTNPEVGDA